MPTPTEIFHRMRDSWLNGDPELPADLFTEDVIIEMPFAPPGRPNHIRGRDAVLAFTRAGRAGLPIRFEQCRELAVHQTANPAVIIVEYQLTGTHTGTSQVASAAFIGVLTARDGQIAGWREYQDIRAIADALR